MDTAPLPICTGAEQGTFGAVSCAKGNRARKDAGREAEGRISYSSWEIDRSLSGPIRNTQKQSESQKSARVLTRHRFHCGTFHNTEHRARGSATFRAQIPWTPFCRARPTLAARCTGRKSCRGLHTGPSPTFWFVFLGEWKLILSPLLLLVVFSCI